MKREGETETMQKNPWLDMKPFFSAKANVLPYVISFGSTATALRQKLKARTRGQRRDEPRDNRPFRKMEAKECELTYHRLSERQTQPLLIDDTSISFPSRLLCFASYYANLTHLIRDTVQHLLAP